MDIAPVTVSGLSPLPYQTEVVEHLKAAEPDVWAWASSLEAQEQHASDVRTQLLRDTYRLTSDSHPVAYELSRKACERLSIDVSVTLYQANGSGMNATLCFLPGEAHIVLQGPVLERLEDLELLALLGHELAHYRLWSQHDGEFLVADRILNQSADSAQGGGSFVETARLYGLHTELYADRGAALAAQSSEVAIAMLVKVYTGIAEVDAQAYLKQALELDQNSAQLSQGTSHPESFLRSQAIDMWWRQDSNLDAWLQKRVRGPLQLNAMDLLGQVMLTDITRRLIARFLQNPELKSDQVLTQVRQYFSDWSDATSALDPATLGSDNVAPNVQEYLHYVMLDLALVDESLREQALVQAASISTQMGGQELLTNILKRDLKLAKRELNTLAKHMKGSVSP